MAQKDFSEIELLLRWIDSIKGYEKVFVDVGAHVGSSIRPFALRGWRIIAFEPEPTNYKELRTKFKIFPKVTCLAKAVSDTNKQQVPFYTSSEHWGIHTLQPFHPTHQSSLTVETVRLDNVLNEFNINGVAILKIDIEGADYLALKSFDFERFQPEFVMCEFMDERSEANFGYTHHDMARYMANQGYTTFVVEWSPIVEYSRRDSISTSQHYFLQCVPYPLDHQPAWGNLIFIPQDKSNQFASVLSDYLNDLEKPDIVKLKPYLKRIRSTYRFLREKFRGLEIGLLLSVLLLIYSLSPLPGNKITAFLTTAPFFFAWRQRMVRLFRSGFKQTPSRSQNRVNKLASQATKLGKKAKSTSEKEISYQKSKNSIINLIDVGSSGNLPEPWRENEDKILHLLKFEPRDEADHLDPFVRTIDVALWETDEDRKFYIGAGNAGLGSSLFLQNYEYVIDNFETLRHRGPQHLAETWLQRSQIERVQVVRCRALDNILEELEPDVQYNFLKIDAQGAEYQILKGAEKFLHQNCVGLHLELFELPLYKGITLLPDVVAYLETLGFDLVKKFPAHGSFDSQHDCLFLKKDYQSKALDIIRKVYEL